QKEKVRVYVLARELDIDSKDLLNICRQVGFDVKNQLSSLDPEQRDAVVQLVRQGGGVAVAPAPKSAAPVIPTVSSPVPVLHSPRVRREPSSSSLTPRPGETLRPPEPGKTGAPPAAGGPEVPAASVAKPPEVAVTTVKPPE